MPLLSIASASLLLLLLCGVANSWVPRSVVIEEGKFVNRKTGATEIMNGTNVIMKGPPCESSSLHLLRQQETARCAVLRAPFRSIALCAAGIPAVSGATACALEGGSTRGAPCSTFNEHDVAVLRTKAWTPTGQNGRATIIRLGVIWAGGQPTPAAALDADFVARLHAFLSLCEEHNIRVILDIHQDAVGTAQCGEGIPMWYSKQHFPHRIGRPILGPKSSMQGNCSELDTMSWAIAAGDPNYNVLNPCCLRWNAPGGWGSNIEVTDFAELQIEQLVGTAAGRKAYATYVGLLAESVSEHPAAIGIELMNKPPPSLRPLQALRGVLCCDPKNLDLAVGVSDTGNDPISDDSRLPATTKAWLRQPICFMRFTATATRVAFKARGRRPQMLWRMLSS